MALFEGYERRIDKINGVLREYGLENIEQAKTVCEQHGINVDSVVKGIQPIAFENAVWAYTLGCAIALKKGAKTAADAAADIGIGLQAFCISGSVADQRQVGASATATSAKCCSRRKRSALPSSRDTKALPPPKAP